MGIEWGLGDDQCLFFFEAVSASQTLAWDHNPGHNPPMSGFMTKADYSTHNMHNFIALLLVVLLQCSSSTHCQDRRPGGRMTPLPPPASLPRVHYPSAGRVIHFRVPGQWKAIRSPSRFCQAQEMIPRELPVPSRLPLFLYTRR